MIITIKSLPVSKNIYGNWHWARKMKYSNMIERELWAELYVIKSEPKGEVLDILLLPLKKAKLTFRLYFKNNRRRDSQNYMAGGLIAVIDSLVKLKIIVDDCYDVIGDPTVELYIDKENPRTEIEVVG